MGPLWHLFDNKTLLLCARSSLRRNACSYFFINLDIGKMTKDFFFLFDFYHVFSSSFLTRRDKGQRPIVDGVCAWHVQRHVESLLAGAAHFLGKSYASVRRAWDGILPTGESVCLLKQEVIKEHFYNLIHSPWAAHQSMKWSRLTINITSFNHMPIEVRW